MTLSETPTIVVEIGRKRSMGIHNTGLAVRAALYETLKRVPAHAHELRAEEELTATALQTLARYGLDPNDPEVLDMRTEEVTRALQPFLTNGQKLLHFKPMWLA